MLISEHYWPSDSTAVVKCRRDRREEGRVGQYGLGLVVGLVDFIRERDEGASITLGLCMEGVFTW